MSVQEVEVAAALAPPVFIGGQRRSGTTLMRTLLDRHPNLAGVPHESFFFQDQKFERFFDEMLERHSLRFVHLEIGPREIHRAVGAFVDALFAPYCRQKGAHRWVEKTTKNIKRIDYLFRLFPEAQFIHMIRDPRDTLCSMKARAGDDRPDWAGFTAEVIAPEWVRCVSNGLTWRNRPDRYMEVRYEQLASEPEATLRRVFDFIGEPWDPVVLVSSSERGRGKAFQPIFTSSIGRWKTELSPEEVATIQAVAGELMALLGYDLR